MKWISKLVTLPSGSTSYKEAVAENSTPRIWRIKEIIVISESTLLSDVTFAFYKGVEQVLPDEGALYPIARPLGFDVDIELGSNSALDIRGNNSKTEDVSLLILIGYEDE